MYKIQTLNKISSKGLSLMSRDDYEIATDILNPDAIIVRSANMHDMDISNSVKAVARAGAGTNNIPIDKLTQRGVVVFNTPGANANAVKELVMTALLVSSRPIVNANKWVNTLQGKGDDIATLAEKGKSQFAGPELKGKTLGVIGLGAIGTQVANLAVEFGMEVLGYDPFLSVKVALSLNHRVKIAQTLEGLLSKCDYITLHVPETPDTKGMINSNTIKNMKNGVRLINLARGGLVVNTDIVKAIATNKISYMVTDFSTDEFLCNDNILCLPHLGASTPEAEENCASMAVMQLKAFLETGSIENSVNFPRCKIDFDLPKGGTRLCVSIKNVPTIISKVATAISNEHLNISNMINQSRGELAYNVIDVEGIISNDVIENVKNIDSVTGVRAIKG